MNKKELINHLRSKGFELKNTPVDIDANSYFYHKGRTLSDCYGRYSTKKQLAYNYCLDLCNSVSGENFGVRSYNCMIFTCHFTFNFDGKQFYCVITKAHNYAYPIGEKIV